MIERKFRLPSSIVFHSPLIVSEKEFLMKAQRNNVAYNRFGFVVGKSVDKLSTGRNSLKRLFRSYIEQLYLGKQGNYDVLFVLRPASKAIEKIELVQKINAALGKVGLA